MAKTFSLRELALAVMRGEAEIIITTGGETYRVSELPDRGGIFGERYLIFTDKIQKPATPKKRRSKEANNG